MTPEEAKALILYEGYAIGGDSDNAMFVMVRVGDDPGPERMQRLLTALRIVFETLEGHTQIDRKLAAALWILGDTIMDNLQSWERTGRKWRDGFQEEVIDLITVVESIFTGEWYGTTGEWYGTP